MGATTATTTTTPTVTTTTSTVITTSLTERTLMTTRPPPPTTTTTTKMTVEETGSACGGLWSHLQPAPPDPIMGLVQAFRADPAPAKINLSQGAYRTEEGRPYVLPSVREAERAVV